MLIFRLIGFFWGVGGSKCNMPNLRADLICLSKPLLCYLGADVR